MAAIRTSRAGPARIAPRAARRRWAFFRAGAVLAAVCALGMGLAAGSQAATVKPKKPSKHATAPASEVALTPDLTSGPGATVTMPPVGLSIEYPVMAQDLGGAACPPPALVSELQRLGSPPIELAGQSQDFTVPAGLPPGPPSSWEAITSYVLPTSFWGQLHCLLSATGEPLTVGLNARIGQLSWAEQMVAQAQASATNGLGFSLGNEPDLYYLPDYASLDKPQGDEEAIDVDHYLAVAGYLEPAIGGAPLTGPELSLPAHWQAQLPHVIEALHERTVGVHLYPLTDCRTPRAVTLQGLLSAGVGNAPARLAWVVADANAAGVPAIISEANSASCGGKAGVSDSPAAGVWALRFVLSALKTGFREVRFHFSGDPYDPFVMRGGEVLRRPLESAMAALNQWLPVGSTLRTVPGVRELLATAVARPAGGTLLILDNEGTKPRPVVLRGATSVNVALLSATVPGLQSEQLSAVGGRIKLTVPLGAVAAVSTAP
ncbi:MAG: hypothetical protein ACLQBB_12435 [Solirubrobacteraceae bacterium]